MIRKISKFKEKKNNHTKQINSFHKYLSIFTNIVKYSHNIILCFFGRNHNTVFSSFTTYHIVCNKSNTTGATDGTGTVCPSGEPEFTPGFHWSLRCPIINFCVVFVDRCLCFGQSIVCPSL